MKYNCEQTIWGVLRILLGWTFFWPFLDKVYGLGFSTVPDKSWLNGISPAAGFLKFGSTGPFASFYHSIAGSPVVDWLFMMGLLGIGLALLLGVGVKIASNCGILLLVLIYLAAFPPKQNPFLDEHLIYSVVLLGLPYVHAGKYFGFGEQWAKTKLVQKYPILQ